MSIVLWFYKHFCNSYGILTLSDIKTILGYTVNTFEQLTHNSVNINSPVTAERFKEVSSNKQLEAFSYSRRESFPPLGKELVHSVLFFCVCAFIFHMIIYFILYY